MEKMFFGSSRLTSRLMMASKVTPHKILRLQERYFRSFDEKIMAANMARHFPNMSELDRGKYQNDIDGIAGDLKLLENIFHEIRREIALLRKKFERSKLAETRAIEISEQLLHILKNLPNDLAKNIPKRKQNDDECDVLEVVVPKVDVELPKIDVELPKKSIESLRKDEFDSIPKYIKGRLSLATLNEAIVDFNLALEKKYYLVNKPLSKVGQFELTLYKLYKKQQETIKTKGIYFCSRDDPRKFPSYKFDNMTKSILSCLCHSKRTRFLYGAGTSIYAIN